MVFGDGKVTEHSCGNFEDAGPGTLEPIRALGQLELMGCRHNAGNDKDAGTPGHWRASLLVVAVIMRNHDWLPWGEFAIVPILRPMPWPEGFHWR